MSSLIVRYRCTVKMSVAVTVHLSKRRNIYCKTMTTANRFDHALILSRKVEVKIDSR